MSMSINLQISYQFFDKTVTKELIPSGQHMRVNNTNRESNWLCTHTITCFRFHSLLTDFVSMYVDHVLNTSIADQFSAFYEGFHSVCNSAALKVIKSIDFMTKDKLTLD